MDMLSTIFAAPSRSPMMAFLPYFLRKKTSLGSFLSSSSLVIPAQKIASPKPAARQLQKTPTARDVARAIRIISDANNLSAPLEQIRWSKVDIEAAWALLLDNPILYRDSILFAYVRACVATNTTIELAYPGADFDKWLWELQKRAYADFEIVIAAIVKGAKLPASDLVTKVIAERAAEELKEPPYVSEFSPEGAVFQKVHIVDADVRVLYLRATQRDMLDPLVKLEAKDPNDPDEVPRIIARATVNLSAWRVEEGWYVPEKKHNGPRKKGSGSSSPVTIKQPSQKTKN